MKDYIIGVQPNNDRPKDVYKKTPDKNIQKYIDACLNCKQEKCNGDCSLKQMLKNGKGKNADKKRMGNA